MIETLILLTALWRRKNVTERFNIFRNLKRQAGCDLEWLKAQSWKAGNCDYAQEPTAACAVWIYFELKLSLGIAATFWKD